eukprot:14348838-Alexandrium_andersonii.AAC.1
MSASLVGSEMCIRDSTRTDGLRPEQCNAAPTRGALAMRACAPMPGQMGEQATSGLCGNLKVIEMISPAKQKEKQTMLMLCRPTPMPATLGQANQADRAL